jgi:ABC-type transport system involved in multi-copper enzyme maturation permease subunit
MNRNNPFFLVASVCVILGAVLFFAASAGVKVLEIPGTILLFAGFVLLTNANNRAIAVNTFREALRNKVLYIILVFAVLMIGFAVVLGSISIGENDRVVKHVGLLAITIFGVFMAMFVGVNLVYDEMERRTIYTIIAHGVARQDFIIGKFLGLLLTITFNFLLMGLILSAVLYAVPEAHWHWLVPYAIFMSLFKMMIIIGFAILFSSFSTPIISAVLTLGVFIIGSFSDDLLEYIKILGHDAYAFQNEVTVPLLNGIYMLLPHLAEFNLEDIADRPEQFEFSLFPMGYGLLYTSLVLFLASWIFSRKDLR